MMVAGCCLFAMTVTAPADAGTPTKQAPATLGAEKSRIKVKKRVKARSATYGHKPGTHEPKAMAGAVRPPFKQPGIKESGLASWYGGARQGKRTANGEIFDKYELTAAHRTLPLESKVRVTNTANGRSVTVRVTDRGPASKNRIIDLSQSAAEELGMKESGLATVKLETLPTLAKSDP
jgi:rare lipoprotein A (peptidoglycan hydrolase)